MMKTILMSIKLHYDDETWHGDDEEAKQWFTDDVLCGGNLRLGDFGDVGDMIGDVEVLEYTLEYTL